MDKEKLIEYIAGGKWISESSELMDWVSGSEKNKEEYIRYKNLWAIMQRGQEMTKEQIDEDYKIIKRRSGGHNNKTLYLNVLKYAAVIFVAIVGGYFLRTIKTDEVVTMSEIVVPKGNRSEIVLPDGTRVWLNNNSKLTYPSDFLSGNREVKLIGKAFFDVIRNEKKPFVVDAGELSVKVLGTQFGVTAYPEDEQIQTVLVEGKVEVTGESDGGVETLILSPGDGVTLDKRTGKLIREKVNTDFASYWLQGAYKFNKERFDDLAKKIERIYHVKIIFMDKSLEERRFTGAFDEVDNINSIMEVLKKASGKPFEYRREKDNIYISLKNRKMSE